MVTGHKKDAGMGDAGDAKVLYIMALRPDLPTRSGIPVHTITVFGLFRLFCDMCTHVTPRSLNSLHSGASSLSIHTGTTGDSQYGGVSVEFHFWSFVWSFRKNEALNVKLSFRSD